MIDKLFRAVCAASVAVVCVSGAAGCARAKAKTAPDSPPLDMPAPPARDIEPNDSEPPQPMTLPQEPARNTPPRPRPAPTREQPRANETPRPGSTGTVEPPRPEPPLIEPKPPEEPARTPPPTLQTTPAQADVEVERNIRATMSRAANDLNRIDYRVLNSDARTQYDTAKGFIRQAEAAIGRKNLEFAKTLAEKAAALAAQLGGK